MGILDVPPLTKPVADATYGLKNADRSSLNRMTFTRANGGNPVFTVAAQNPVSGATPSPSIYWPWIIDARAQFGSSALDEFYMYYSTDHDTGTGGIYLATGPTELGPWSTRGRVYVDTTSGTQSETPTVFPDPTGAVALIMMYQQGGVSGAVGQQTTMYATSNDGVTWTRGGIALDIPTGWPSDGHTGYARVAQVGNALYCHSLAGGGDYGKFALWSSTDGRKWWLQPDHLNYGIDQTGDGRLISWNAGNVIDWYGAPWWVGFTSDFTSGTTPKDARLCVAPIAPSLRHLLAPPKYVLYPAVGTETTNYRAMFSFVSRKGVLIMYYQSGSSFFVATAQRLGVA
jgi:hypothetical protein